MIWAKELAHRYWACPPEEDWVLFAPYNDKSLMRDALAYKLGRDLGQYAPRTRFCEVIINDIYQGVYVLIEKIKRDKNRVDINKLDPDENSGNNLTGGYIIKIDKSTGSGNGGWTSTYTPPGRNGNQTIYFQYDYPKDADITSTTEKSIFSKSFPILRAPWLEMILRIRFKGTHNISMLILSLISLLPMR
ncbi:MAG: CotH kinase family protein [Cytophagales bacterium]|nr:CotH kinase family protein [Cytophagales bacterium]